MRRDRTLELVNVSFLDLFACTIGAVIFIILIIFLNSLNLVKAEAAPPPDAADEEEGLLREEIARLREPGLEARERELKKRLAQARADLDAARREASAEMSPEQRRRVEQIDSEKREAAAALRAARDARDAAVRAASSAEAESERALGALTPEQRRWLEHGNEFKFRVPMRRKTARIVGVEIECVQSRAYVLNDENYRASVYHLDILSETAIDKYNDVVARLNANKITYAQALAEWKRICQKGDARQTNGRDGCRFEWIGFDETFLSIRGFAERRWKTVVWELSEPRESARADRLESLEGGGSSFEKMIDQLDPESNVVSFVVRPSGFEIFRACRAFAASRGFQFTWELWEEDQKNQGTFGSGTGIIK